RQNRCTHRSSAVQQELSSIVIARRSRSTCAADRAHRSIATLPWFRHRERGVAVPRKQRHRAPRGIDGSRHENAVVPSGLKFFSRRNGCAPDALGREGNEKEEVMRNLLLAVATGVLLVAAVSASPPGYFGAGPGGAGGEGRPVRLRRRAAVWLRSLAR